MRKRYEFDLPEDLTPETQKRISQALIGSSRTIVEHKDRVAEDISQGIRGTIAGNQQGDPQ